MEDTECLETTVAGVGLLGSLGVNFGAGALGSAFEQKIGTGKVDFRESVTDGLTNAVSSAIYGNDKLKSLGSAFLRGAGAGVATAAINNLFDALCQDKQKEAEAEGTEVGTDIAEEIDAHLIRECIIPEPAAYQVLSRED